MLASSVSVSVVPAAAPVKPRPPRLDPPVASFCVTGAEAGSGHSVYGVGLLNGGETPTGLWQSMNSMVPSPTVWPAVVATALASVMCVASGMFVMTREAAVVGPSALRCGTVTVKPSGNTLESATASVVAFDVVPTTVVWRVGHVAASRTTQDFGRFSTPLFCCHRYLVNQRLIIT